MDDHPRQMLLQLIQDHGPALGKDARRVRSFLLDLAGQYKREINVLVIAAQEGVPDRLETAGSEQISLLLPGLTRRLQENWGLSPDAAHWAVTSWAQALGKLSSRYTPPPAFRSASAQGITLRQDPPAGEHLWQLDLGSDLKIEFVQVPAGLFAMGSPDSDSFSWPDEKPQHLIHLGGYWIARYPITVSQFAHFVDHTGYRTTAEEAGSGGLWSGSGWETVQGATWWQPQGPGSRVDHKAGHPVTMVSWHDARAFCEWAAKAAGRSIRLPTEAEWEKAARGGKSAVLGAAWHWPWGNDPPNPERCNFGGHIQDTTPVGKYSLPVSGAKKRFPGDAARGGDSPYACGDMAGNVWEWTHSLFMKYPYRSGDGREDANAPGPRVLRGGSFDDDLRDVRCAARLAARPDSRNERAGFRILVSLS